MKKRGVSFSNSENFFFEKIFIFAFPKRLPRFLKYFSDVNKILSSILKTRPFFRYSSGKKCVCALLHYANTECPVGFSVYRIHIHNPPYNPPSL